MFRLQFRLRTLFLLVTVSAVVLGVHRWRRVGAVERQLAHRCDEQVFKDYPLGAALSRLHGGFRVQTTGHRTADGRFQIVQGGCAHRNPVNLQLYDSSVVETIEAILGDIPHTVTVRPDHVIVTHEVVAVPRRQSGSYSFSYRCGSRQGCGHTIGPPAGALEKGTSGDCVTILVAEGVPQRIVLTASDDHDDRGSRGGSLAYGP